MQDATLELSKLLHPAKGDQSGPEADGWDIKTAPRGDGAEATKGFRPALERTIREEREQRKRDAAQ